MLTFQVLAQDATSHARRGTLTLNHGVIQTPISCSDCGITPFTVP